MKIEKIVNNILELELHIDINKKLNNINKLINIALLGSDGVGKKTRLYFLLEKIYGEDIYTITKQEIIISSKIKINFEYYKSNHHIEIDLSKYKKQDIILKEFIEPLLCSINLCNNSKNVIIFKNFDKYNKRANEILSIFIEKYEKTTKFIILGKYIKNYKIKSLFCNIIFPDLEYKETRKLIKKYNKKITYKNIDKILEKSKFFSEKYNLNNINKLIKMSMITNKFINFCNNIEYILDEILIIINKPSFKFNEIDKIKEMLYKMYAYNYPIINIIKILQNKIINMYNKNNIELIMKIVKLSSDISQKIIYSNKRIMFLELFIVKYIKFLKNY